MYPLPEKNVKTHDIITNMKKTKINNLFIIKHILYMLFGVPPNYILK